VGVGIQSSCAQWRLHNPLIPHVIALKPGLEIYKIYNGYWCLGRLPVEDLRQDLGAVTKKPERSTRSRVSNLSRNALQRLEKQ
jgi:hypothetical protein